MNRRDARFADGRRGLRVLVPTTSLPSPDRAAGDRRFLALLEILARRHRVDFCAVSAAPLPIEDLARAKALLQARGLRFLNPGWQSLSAALFKNWYDIALFEFYHQAERLADFVRAKQPGARVVVDSVDVHFERELSGAALGLIDAAHAHDTRRRELSVYRSADAVIAASEPDAGVLRREGIENIFVFPIVVDPRSRPLRARRAEVLFIGGFKHPPNADGLLWFTQAIWPHVRREVPDARLTVIGSDAPDEVLALDHEKGVRVIGYVPETASYLDEAAVSVAPLRYGGGMKGKVVEAMASGLPVVTTSFGSQGLKARPGHDLVVADDPISFARAVADLLQNPRMAEQVGLAGQALATDLCDRDRLREGLDDTLYGLVPRRSELARQITWTLSAPSRSLPILRRRLRAWLAPQGIGL